MEGTGKKTREELSILPDCPGGGMPPVPLGNRTKMESTAALLPKQGSRAMGFGTDCRKKKEQKKVYYTSQAAQILVNTHHFQRQG